MQTYIAHAVIMGFVHISTKLFKWSCYGSCMLTSGLHKAVFIWMQLKLIGKLFQGLGTITTKIYIPVQEQS